ncbi:MAG: CsgG/HfaB family protein, partial [Phycisphaerales bacterium]
MNAMNGGFGWRDRASLALRAVLVGALVWAVGASGGRALAQGMDGGVPGGNGGADTARASARPVMGVLRVRPTASVQQGASSAGHLDDLTRIVESLDPQLINALQATGKFTVIARSDLEEILNEHEIQRVIRDDPALAFRLAGVEYGVVFTIDGYQDETAIMRSNRPGESDRVARASRQINISLVATVYEVETGRVFETAAIEHEIRTDLEYGTAPAATG